MVSFDGTNMWLIQYKRVERWLTRIEEISNPEHQIKPEDALDYIVAYFQNCWHLKDWLAEDPKTKVSKELIEGFIKNESKYIKISGVIANGSKHLTFYENDNRQMPSLSAKLVGDDKHQVWQSATYEISQGNMTYDAVDLARKCLKEWKVFFEKNKLLD